MAARGVRIRTLDGELHCEDGPAEIQPNGDQSWWVFGQLHRADGPAIEHVDGWRGWYFEGNQYDFDEWLQLVPITDEEKVMLKLIYG